MKRKTILFAVLAIALVLLGGANGCCKKCCSPSIEVSIEGIMRLCTWDSLQKFPGSPNYTLQGSEKPQVNWPYVIKVDVKNESPDTVRGVIVVFTINNIGVSDPKDPEVGTPIGTSAVDLPPHTTKTVSSPSFSIHHPKDICIIARIHHPCDTDLENNDDYENMLFVLRDMSWILDTMPFVVDFAEEINPLDLEIAVEPMEGIEAYIVDSIGNKPLKQLDFEPGIPQNLLLVVKNIGAKFEPDDTFKVKVSAIKDDKEISSFTARYKIVK